ncbi:MAG: hypothetical protein R3B95_02775 [Nitrospirales bacterium]|nr:hypothetical protein [Nitrospirales bacterium]
MERSVPSGLWGIGLAIVLVACGVLIFFGWDMESDTSDTLLAAAILLACFCGFLGQQGSSPGSDDVGPILLLGGLGLGAVIGVEPINQIFLIGLLAYAGFFLTRYLVASLQKTLALVHLSLALIVGVLVVFMEEDGDTVGRLFLSLTLIPLVPLHLPFLGIVRSSRESLGSVWLVVWLAAGLSQLQDLESMLHVKWMGMLPVMALVSAVYACLNAMGHHLPREGIAYGAVTLLALLWGMSETFPHMAEWGPSFGMAVALLMSALLCSYAFLHERFGAHNLTTLQGLGSGLPRFRGVFTFLISLIMLLPVLPVVGGFRTIPSHSPEAHSQFPVWLLLFTVWLSVSWVFTTMLHQTAFGNPRVDVPHRDLSSYELWSLFLLMGMASVCGTLA